MSLPFVTVYKRGVLRLESGHLWIYRSDVRAPKNVPGGSAVRVLDEQHRYLATAFYSTNSQITLRILSREDVPVDQLLRNRLELAVDLRRRIYPNDNALRLVHGEADLLPGLVVDQYGSALSIQTLTEAMDQRKEQIAKWLVELTGATCVVERNDVGARRHEGLELKKGVLLGELPGPIAYREGQIELEADLLEGQKTGSFLDQRENHVLAGEFARGRALDCFSYVGGFALQLARKAEQVTAIDASEKAVADIQKNAQRNKITNVDTQVANAFDFLRAAADRKERYDIIVLDPPAFTKNKESIEPALRGYKEINLRALSMLNPGGILVSASCSYHVDEGMFAEMLLGAAKDARRSVQLLEKRGAGRDHPELMGVPETRYLKCFFVRAL